MSSLRRILSSQQNGRRSHGPQAHREPWCAADIGKPRPSHNAITHGLPALTIVLQAPRRGTSQLCFLQNEPTIANQELNQ